MQHNQSEMARLTRYVNQAEIVQKEMREILNPLTPGICGPCEHKCCEGFPLEGWFSLEDYVLFRVKYEKPVPPPNRMKRDTACHFLTPEGCSLPENMRPFTCVKINCERLTQSIKSTGMYERFNQLKNKLDTIHKQTSHSINGKGSVASLSNLTMQELNIEKIPEFLNP